MPYISRFTELFAAIDEDLWAPEQVAKLLTVSVEKLAEWRTKQTGPQWLQFVEEVRYSTIALENFITEAFDKATAQAQAHPVSVTPAKQSRKQPASTPTAGTIPPWMQLAAAPAAPHVIPPWAAHESSAPAKKPRKRTVAKV